jgi:hypothetical protein
MTDRNDVARETSRRPATLAHARPRETGALDLAGLVVSAIMMLGPLAAAALTRGTY